MAVPIFSILISLTVLFATLILYVYIYFKRKYKYWDKFNIPVVAPVIPHGSLGNLFKRTESLGISLAKVYKTLKDKGEKHGGIYILKDAVYIPLDPVLIKNILIKDFPHFMNRSMYSNEKDDPLSVNLLTMDGTAWKNMRHKLTPTFTSGKMKQMFQTFWTCSDRLVKKIDEYTEKQEAIEVKSLLGCFTTDIIGSCAFGIECNSIEHPNCEFRIYGNKIFSFTPLQLAKSIFARNFPDFSRAVGLTTVPKDVSKFFIKVVDENLKYREDNNVKRNDFFQLLLEVEKRDGENEITRRNRIAAQSFVFFNAGFETSSTAMTFAVYELALNPDIQEKMRNEVLTVLEKHNGEITYDALMEMEYLNKVVDETLRKHPPIALLARKSIQDYPVEGTDVVIKKGSRVFISVLGIHFNPEYYPEPEIFDPERFSEENKRLRPPCTFLPFGEGPRNCIGLRFGLLQIKLGLAVIAKNYKFSLNPKTGTPKIDPRSFIYRFSDGIFVDFEKL